MSLKACLSNIFHAQAKQTAIGHQIIQGGDRLYQEPVPSLLYLFKKTIDYL